MEVADLLTLADVLVLETILACQFPEGSLASLALISQVAPLVLYAEHSGVTGSLRCSVLLTVGQDTHAGATLGQCRLTRHQAVHHCVLWQDAHEAI